MLEDGRCSQYVLSTAGSVTRQGDAAQLFVAQPYAVRTGHIVCAAPCSVCCICVDSRPRTFGRRDDDENIAAKGPAPFGQQREV